MKLPSSSITCSNHANPMLLLPLPDSGCLLQPAVPGDRRQPGQRKLPAGAPQSARRHLPNSPQTAIFLQAAGSRGGQFVVQICHLLVVGCFMKLSGQQISGSSRFSSSPPE